MSKWVFDVECDGLLQEATRMWVLCAHNLETGEDRHWVEGDFGWREVFDSASAVVGHNILGYDVLALEKLFGYRFPKTCKLNDTMLLSQILDYRRFNGAGHSLENWGKLLQFPKGEFSDWTRYSEEMLEYCKRDVELNVRIWHHLLAELRALASRAPQIRTYVKAEHAVALWCGQASLRGWPFDVAKARELELILEGLMQEAEERLKERLGVKCVAMDKVKGVVDHKSPKWTKQGFYDANTCNNLGVEPVEGLLEPWERPVNGPYSRVKFVPLELGSVADVKVFLYRNGWKPTEWNIKRMEDGSFVKTSPKITDDSIEFLGGDGKLYSDYAVAKSRYAIIKTWLENVDADGNLHGDCMTIGTPSMRARHSIIVNVPSTDSQWGKEMRQLFRCLPGWKLIGCDSKSNQGRGLAHYLNDAEYTRILLHDDIHVYNAEKLTDALVRMMREGEDVDFASLPFNEKTKRHTVPRSSSKRIYYAFMFGASGGKLWSYVFGYQDQERGNKLKKYFTKAVPGFEALLDRLKRIYGATKKNGDPYVPSIAGNRIYVDSPHKLLVYTLQSCEKVTCAAACMLTMERLEAEGIPYVPLIMMHDEIDFMVPEEHAERAAEIGKQAFADGPKLFGIEIMDGDAKIGETWFDVH